MTAPAPGHPVTVAVREDISGGFSDPGNFDPRLALDRAGNLSIDREGDHFTVSFIGKNFRRGPAATINLDEGGVFDLVQDCRDAWDRAFASVEVRRPRPGGDGLEIHHPFENEWKQPVDEASFRAVAGKLAVAGHELFVGLFERNRGTELDNIAADLRTLSRGHPFALTVYAPRFHIPWRMLYTHPGEDKLQGDGANFDPAGFWGYRHVIEQFTSDWAITDHLSARNSKLAFGAALDQRIDTQFSVECIKRHRDFIQSSAAQLAYTEWTTKEGFLTGVGVDPFNQQVLYLLCHAEGAGSTSDPSLAPPLVQLGDGESITAVAVRKKIANKFKPSPPLVFINACRGGQLATLVRHGFTFASELIEQGAICVVGPQIEVPAVFAGEFGKQFFERFIAQTRPPPQAGLVLRDITQSMWEQRNPFGLVYSLYAGADCHIRWTEEATS